MNVYLDNSDLSVKTLRGLGNKPAITFELKCNYLYLTNRGSRARLRAFAERILALCDWADRREAKKI